MKNLTYKNIYLWDKNIDIIYKNKIKYKIKNIKYKNKINKINKIMI